jgi:hypothetical protein
MDTQEEVKEKKVRRDVRVFNFNSIQIPEGVESPDRNGWINYGGGFSKYDNLYPQYLIEILSKSSRHNAIVRGKASLIGGNGWVKDKLSQEALLFIKNQYNELNLDDIVYRCAFDLTVYGAFTLNVVWSKDRETISEISYVDTSRLRVGEQDDKNRVPCYYLCDDWSNTRVYPPTKYPGFSLTDRSKASQILYVKEFSSGFEYHGKPEYIAGIKYMEAEGEIATHHLASIKNGFYPAMSITFLGSLPSDDEMDENNRQLKNKFQGAMETGSVVITYAESADTAPILTPIKAETSDDHYVNLSKEIETTIYQAHRVTNSALFGVKTPGELGATSELLESLNIFQGWYVDPKQRILERAFNTLGRVNGIEPLSLNKYELKLDIKVSPTDIISILSSSLSDEQKIETFKAIGYSDEMANNLVKPKINTI